MVESEKFIALIDSGVGGISVLAEARKWLPNENFLFYADTAHAPYGGMATNELADLMYENVQKLEKRGAKAILIACNTATSAAASDLRKVFHFPVLGLEPALKPAIKKTQGQIVVLGTELTMREKKFRNLLETYGKGREIISIPCPGLMEIVEEDPLGEKAESYLMDVLEPYWATVQAVVLGCTHYVFLRPILSWLLPNAELFDGNAGVCSHLKNVLTERDLTGGNGQLVWDCSLPIGGDRAAYLEKCRKFYERVDQ